MQVCRRMKLRLDCLVYLGFILAIVRYTFAITVFTLPHWCDISLMLAALACFMAYIILTQVKGKGFLFFLTSVTLAVAVYLSNGHDDGLIITVIAIYALRGIDLAKLIKCYTIAACLFFIMVIGYSLITGENIGLYEGFRIERGYEYRYTFGFIHPNSLQAVYMKLVCGLILSNWGKRNREFKYFMLETGNLILFLFSDSRTGFIVLTMILLMAFGMKYVIRMFKPRGFLFIISVFDIFVIGFTVFACFFYTKYEWVKWISSLITGRFELAYRFIREFPVRFLGIDITFIDKYRFENEQILDCGIINTLLHFGLFVFMVSIVIYIVGSRKMWREDNYAGMIVAAGFILYSVMENVYFDIFANLGLILCCYYVVNGKKGVSSRGVKYG